MPQLSAGVQVGTTSEMVKKKKKEINAFLSMWTGVCVSVCLLCLVYDLNVNRSISQSKTTHNRSFNWKERKHFSLASFVVVVVNK